MFEKREDDDGSCFPEPVFQGKSTWESMKPRGENDVNGFEIFSFSFFFFPKLLSLNEERKNQCGKMMNDDSRRRRKRGRGGENLYFKFVDVSSFESIRIAEGGFKCRQ